MKTNALVLFLAGAACALAAHGPANRGATAGNASVTGPCPIGCDQPCANVSSATTPVSLSAAAQSALLFQIDEERMARELYTAFGAKWGLRPFEVIPQSESRHESVLRELAVRAGMTLPSSAAGRFDSAEVQQRHDALLALGLESASGALRASVYVEEQDIADLRALQAGSDSPELKEIAAVLERASGHHLGAFLRVLTAQGATYSPQVLAPDDFNRLSVATPGRNGGGCGVGRGFRGGR